MRLFSIVVLSSVCRCRLRTSRKLDLIRIGDLPNGNNEERGKELGSDFNN